MRVNLGPDITGPADFWKWYMFLNFGWTECWIIMAVTPKLSLKEVNEMDYPEFISVFSSAIEHGTLAAACVWEARPFHDISSLCKSFTDFLHSLSLSCQTGLVRCYPDLAGTLSGDGMLSKESTLEQKGAGLLDLTDTEKNELSVLNDKYRSKFEFSFVVCAKENKKETIRRELRQRLENTAAEELNTAIKEIGKIANYRIKDMVDCSNCVEVLQ